MITGRIQGLQELEPQPKSQPRKNLVRTLQLALWSLPLPALCPGHSTGAAATRPWIQLLHPYWILSDFLELCVLCKVGRRASDELGSGHLLAATCWLWGEGASAPLRLPQWEALLASYLPQDAHRVSPGAGQLKNGKCPLDCSDSGTGTRWLDSKVAPLKNPKPLRKTWKLPILAHRILLHFDIRPSPLCGPCHSRKCLGGCCFLPFPSLILSL